MNIKFIPSIYFIIIFTVIGYKSFSQELVNYEMKFQIEPQSNTGSLFLRTLLPMDIIDKQSLKKIDFSIQPDSIFIKEGRKYVDFSFKNIKAAFTLNIKIKILIKSGVISRTTNTESLEKYLQPEKFIEVNDPKILATAKKLRANNKLQTVIKTLKFLHHHFSSDSKYYAEAIGARKALELRSGDCTEYCDLFTALCRANNIGVRVIEGLISNFNLTPRHSWVEFYDEDNNVWIRLDPTKNKTFQKKSNLGYIQLSNTRNDKYLNNYSLWAYNYTSIQPKINLIISFYN